MTGPFADRLFRIAFAVAGIYNLAFGFWAAVWPLEFFELFDIAPPRYPGIWACLGMVVGVYGLLYLHAAWKLETAWPIIAVGLLGKVLGPVGMAVSISDDWPRRLGMVCVYNDLIWWLPFGLFLVRGTRVEKWLAARAPSICVVTHAVALGVLALYLQPGTLVESDVVARAKHVSTYTSEWSIGWAIWMAAAATLVGFYAWWGSRLAARNVAMAAVVITGFGMVFDFSGEGSAILRLVERTHWTGAASLGLDADSFMRVERDFTLFSAGAANGLYTVGGVLLTLITPNLPRWVRWAMWGTWLAGGVMSVAAVMNNSGGMVASSAVLFPLLLVWVAWMGTRWRTT